MGENADRELDIMSMVGNWGFEWEGDDVDEIISVVTAKQNSVGWNPEWELNSSVSELLFFTNVRWKLSKSDNVHKINCARVLSSLWKKFLMRRKYNFEKSAST